MRFPYIVSSAISRSLWSLNSHSLSWKPILQKEILRRFVARRNLDRRFPPKTPDLLVLQRLRFRGFESTDANPDRNPRFIPCQFGVGHEGCHGRMLTDRWKLWLCWIGRLCKVWRILGGTKLTWWCNGWQMEESPVGRRDILCASLW